MFGGTGNGSAQDTSDSLRLPFQCGREAMSYSTRAGYGLHPEQEVEVAIRLGLLSWIKSVELEQS